jgi:hypothetical protein
MSTREKDSLAPVTRKLDRRAKFLEKSNQDKNFAQAQVQN